MKICLVHEEYPEETNYGGIATYQKNLAEEFVKQGNEVIVICRGIEKTYEYTENGVKIYRIFVEDKFSKVKQYKDYRIKVSRLLQKLQAEDKIDIIEVPDWGAETIFFEKYRKVPLVIRLHTPLKVWLKYNKNNFGKVKKLMLKWENCMLLKADFITCCSQALKKIIIKEFNIEEKNILVNPNPANITNFYRDNKIEKEDKLIFVGSLEERKGICVLANALNIIFQKKPNLKVQFIGKDTNRNSKNISSIELIKKIVNDSYRNNLEFLGQIPNQDINYYLNSAMVGVFPSLFDNFPYVVLEAMATGLQIVGSENSGMKEMLNDEGSLYISGDYNDLAEKILKKFELSLVEKINTKNIERVNKEYNPQLVCSNILDNYNNVINKYRLYNTTKKELEFVLSYVTDNFNIKKYKRENGGVANFVYKVSTNDKQYIIKKYTNRNKFELSNKLYDLYDHQKINIVRPINNNIIKYNQINYNVFDYINNKKIKNINIDFLNSLLNCNRIVDMESSIINKCITYYEYLKKEEISNKLLLSDIKYVIEIYEQLRDNLLLKEKYLNHGDISKGNIIYSEGKYYIIDFDEALVSSKIYDFAVIVVKLFIKNKKINLKKYRLLKEKFLQYDNRYVENDFINIIKFYLCKILLEKFYLYQIGEIDLYSKNQMKDFYKKYIEILKNIDNYVEEL